MPEVILKLEKKDKESLGAVRCIDGLQAAQEGNDIWVRGIITLMDMNKELKQLPVKDTFITDEKNNLFLPGRPTPIGILKELPWQPLIEFINIEPPVAALPGKTNNTIKMKLISSSKERKGNALLTSLNTWKQYAATAPLSRLLALKFCLSEKNEVLIIGNPLPPLPGNEYWETEDILIPAGYDFELAMLPSFINKKLNENKSLMILFNTEGNYQKIDKSFFVTAKRSAVRLSKINND